MLDDVSFRLRSFFRRTAIELDMDEELRSHIQSRADDLERSGLPRAEAQRRARIEFGGPERFKEECREALGTHFLDSLLQDIRFALRMLLKSPGFTVVAVLTLALGIGANTAIFSFFYTLTLRPLPVKDPASVVNVYHTASNQSPYGVFSYPEYVYYRDNNSVFSALAVFKDAPMTLDPGQNPNGTGEPIRALLVSGNYFQVIAKNVELGRTFLPEEDEVPGSHPVAVLSYEFWQSRFGGDPAIVGRPVTLNLMAYTVVGIAPKGFNSTTAQAAQVWIPLMMQDNVLPGADLLHDRHQFWLESIGRLKPGMPRDQAQAVMTALARQFAQPQTENRELLSVTLTPGRLSSPEDLGTSLPIAILLMLAVSLILLIACANVANLVLARCVSRQKEIGVRLSLGASRFRLVRQLLTESMLLAVAGGAIGLLISFWTSRLVLPWIHPPGESGLSLDFGPDLAVFAYTFLVSLFTGLAFGLAPALRSSNQNLNAILREEGSAFGRHVSRSRLRGALVVIQVAISIFLLVGAGLLVRALGKAQSVDLGFEPRNVLVLSANSKLRGYDAPRAAAFDRQLTDRLVALPGVKSVGMGKVAPLGSSSWDSNFNPDDYPSSPYDPSTYVYTNAVSPEYFQTLGIPIVRGRGFTSQDIEHDLKVAVVSEALARHFWPGKDAIGRTFNHGRQVIGVVKDVRGSHLWAADESCLFLPVSLSDSKDTLFFVRTSGAPSALMTALPESVKSLDSGLPVKITRLQDNLALWIWLSQMGALFSGALGLLALFLAMMGVYGVMAYTVSQRTREIGVRMALGSQRADVLRLVFAQSMRLVVIGLLIGLAMSAVGSRLLAKFLYGLSALDAVTFAGVAVLLVAVAVLACWIPARRATRIDPMVALRYE